MKEEIKRFFPAGLGSVLGLTIADITSEDGFSPEHFLMYVIIALLLCLIISYLRVRFKDKSNK